ncbi:YchJ family protein [Pseudomarimonas salicorniae]|uniref:UPF0225 protein M0G41_09355 n=1 Tax=Pseudomarimonas salicorniae TaxID=2933270 RepID=A0ABT0GH49_9GAMM|nr:YchJ family metal-binding protein [Lysobacter sp. CAU 1642]MCK7593876.1 hypothetical protein [Lysobacter sp. CAU 1642]
MSAAEACPCGRARSYRACCGALHAGAPAPDPESLMRSRYSAFVRGNAAYLLSTWHASTRPLTLALDDPPPRWLGLEIKRTWRIDDHHAGVEFVARFRHGGGSAVRQHERSRFVLEAGRWFYLDGAG